MQADPSNIPSPSKARTAILKIGCMMAAEGFARIAIGVGRHWTIPFSIGLLVLRLPCSAIKLVGTFLDALLIDLNGKLKQMRLGKERARVLNAQSRARQLQLLARLHIMRLALEIHKAAARGR